MIAYRRIAVLYFLIMFLSIFIATQVNSILTGVLVLAFFVLVVYWFSLFTTRKGKVFRDMLELVNERWKNRF